jgi:hypothetical protein
MPVIAPQQNAITERLSVVTIVELDWTTNGTETFPESRNLVCITYRNVTRTSVTSPDIRDARLDVSCCQSTPFSTQF